MGGIYRDDEQSVAQVLLSEPASVFSDKARCHSFDTFFCYNDNQSYDVLR